MTKTLGTYLKKKQIAMRVSIIEEHLEKTFPNPTPGLDFDSPFTLLIAVLLSAQCTDERVNKVTPKLFSKYKTPTELQVLSQNQIYEIIKPCGLGPKKSKAIYEICRILPLRFNNLVPKTFEELESLPGVGHKTASVVLSQAFQIPAFAVDTHVHRTAFRWKLSNGKSVQETEADLKKIFPESLWSKRHLQMVLFGRHFCTARGCKFTCSICSALKHL